MNWIDVANAPHGERCSGCGWVLRGWRDVDGVRLRLGLQTELWI